MLADKLKPFIVRYDEISALLSDPSAASDIDRMSKLAKEQRSLEAIKDAALRYNQLLEQIEENKSLLNDPELGELAKEELKSAESDIATLEE